MVAALAQTVATALPEAKLPAADAPAEQADAVEQTADGVPAAEGAEAGTDPERKRRRRRSRRGRRSPDEAGLAGSDDLQEDGIDDEAGELASDETAAPAPVAAAPVAPQAETAPVQAQAPAQPVEAAPVQAEPVQTAPVQAEQAPAPVAAVSYTHLVATVDGQPIGKPGDFTRAQAQLRVLSGQIVEFHSALAVTDGQRVDKADIVTRCRFRRLSDQAIDAYLRAEEPYDTAGSAKAESLGIALMESIQSCLLYTSRCV